MQVVGERKKFFRFPTPCLHCGKPGTAGRGLCNACYLKPKVRYLYPCKIAVKEKPEQMEADEPDDPTGALPGTEEKIRVLEERAARGVGLFHPQDARPVITAVVVVDDEQEKLLRRLLEAQEEKE